jgi:hypothetical protein
MSRNMFLDLNGVRHHGAHAGNRVQIGTNGVYHSIPT